MRHSLLSEATWGGTKWLPLLHWQSSYSACFSLAVWHRTHTFPSLSFNSGTTKKKTLQGFGSKIWQSALKKTQVFILDFFFTSYLIVSFKFFESKDQVHFSEYCFDLGMNRNNQTPLFTPSSEFMICIQTVFFHNLFLQFCKSRICSLIISLELYSQNLSLHVSSD